MIKNTSDYFNDFIDRRFDEECDKFAKDFTLQEPAKTKESFKDFPFGVVTSEFNSTNITPKPESNTLRRPAKKKSIITDRKGRDSKTSASNKQLKFIIDDNNDPLAKEDTIESSDKDFPLKFKNNLIESVKDSEDISGMSPYSREFDVERIKQRTMLQRCQTEKPEELNKEEPLRRGSQLVIAKIDGIVENLDKLLADKHSEPSIDEDLDSPNRNERYPRDHRRKHQMNEDKVGVIVGSKRLSLATVDQCFIADNKEKKLIEKYADQPYVQIVDDMLEQETKRVIKKKKSFNQNDSLNSSSILKKKSLLSLGSEVNTSRKSIKFANIEESNIVNISDLERDTDTPVNKVLFTPDLSKRGSRGSINLLKVKPTNKYHSQNKIQEGSPNNPIIGSLDNLSMESIDEESEDLEKVEIEQMIAQKEKKKKGSILVTRSPMVMAKSGFSDLRKKSSLKPKKRNTVGFVMNDDDGNVKIYEENNDNNVKKIKNSLLKEGTVVRAKGDV